MKKYLTILCILMMLLAAGCAKQQKATPPTADTQDVKADDLEEDGKKIESSVVDFTDMPLYNTLESSTHEIYSSLEDYTDSFNLQDYIIFKGIKKKDSTQFLTIEDENLLTDWRSETPVEVLEAYYGDVQAGDEIIFDEFCAVIEVGGKEFVVCDESTPPIKKNTEYILFLSKSSSPSSTGAPMYSYIAMYHSIHEFDSAVTNSKTTAQYVSAIGQDENDLSMHGKFKRDIFKKYYFEKDKLDTKIDVAKEITKLNKAEYQNITTVDKLHKNDKALFTRLIKQYGAK